MQNREAVWAATYGSYIAQRCNNVMSDGLELPSLDWWKRTQLRARIVADFAVEALGEQLRRPSPSSDSELLDAILEAYASESDFDEYDSALERAFENAIAERGKR